MYYSVIDTDFNIQDMYSSARKVLKKVLVKIGEISFVLFISSGVGYAQEPINSQQDLTEVVSNVQSPSVAFDNNNGRLVTFDKVLVPDLQYRKLMKSLMDHKGGRMSADFLDSFEVLASQLAHLPFRESLARYSVINNFVNINMAFDNNVELEVTQLADVDEVAFSIHHDGGTMAMATATGEVLTRKMLNVLTETKIVDGIS